jgi:hypothetical protein
MIAMHRLLIGLALILSAQSALSQNVELEPLEDSVATKKTQPTPQIKKKPKEFDTTYRNDSRYIEHPNTNRGLYLIDKNKVYYYRVKTGTATREASVRLGPYQPVNLVNPSNTAISFGSVYTVSNIPMILYDFEKDISKKLGRLGYKFGTGLYVAQGHGQFTSGNAQVAEPRGPPEQFTFFLFPFNAGAIYHFDYLEHQWVIPYGEGGVDLFCFGEARSDSANKFGAAFGAAPATHFSLGATIPLGHDSRSFLDLDREYGVKSIGISIEFRDYLSLSSKWNFSGQVYSAGFSATY